MRAPSERARLEGLISYQKRLGTDGLPLDEAIRQADRLERDLADSGAALRLELGTSGMTLDSKVYLGGRDISHLVRGVGVKANAGEVIQAEITLLPDSVDVAGGAKVVTLRDAGGDRLAPGALRNLDSAPPGFSVRCRGLPGAQVGRVVARRRSYELLEELAL